MKNTSISLGNYFDEFVSKQVSVGRYKNVSEVIRAGLRLLEDEESKVAALRNAIQEGIDSGIAHDFDKEKHLQALKRWWKVHASKYVEFIFKNEISKIFRAFAFSLNIVF